MIRISCIGKRRLEVSYIKEEDLFEMRIVLDGGIYPDTYIACPKIPANEFKKLSVFFGER
jgi:hypothetical protein